MELRVNGLSVFTFENEFFIQFCENISILKFILFVYYLKNKNKKKKLI